jgi:hypothetical protein
MDVHPPHEPIHSARDFFLHLFTITVGLLIALSLEAGVEHLHNRHLLHTAESNLRSELHDNRALLASDERYLDNTQQQIEDGLKILTVLKAGKPSADEPSQHWEWDSPQAAAWETARNNGALALMSYDTAESYAIVYGQQQLVNDQATLYIRDIYNISTPLHGNLKVTDLQPTALDLMIADSEKALADLRLLRDYCTSLDRIYSRAADL